MQINIENYRGIKSAKFGVDGISLIAGANFAGKSAIAQAVGAVLSGTPVPVPGVPKTMAGMLVNFGNASGFASLECDSGTARVDWPKAAFKTKGDLPFVSPIAARMESLTPPLDAPDDATKQKRRAELFLDILKAEPTADDLREYLARDGIETEAAAHVWEVVQKQGWDAAHAHAKETGARLKGQWEATTGKRYGARIAEDFVPNDWETELASQSEQSLTAIVTDATDALDGMIAVAAIDDAEREQLETLAAQIPLQEEFVIEAERKLGAATAKYNEALSAHQAMRNPANDRSHACPHCQGAIQFVGGEVKAATPITDAERTAYADQAKLVGELADAGRTARASETTARQALKQAQDATTALNNSKQGNTSQGEVERAREAVANAKRRLTAFVTKLRADRLQNSIVQNTAIIAALDITGVRQQKLTEKIHTFLTESVLGLVSVANWKSIAIEHDMSISYDGRSWALLSESERYRVRVSLQVAVALLDGSCAVVIDAADILDKQGRNGLISLLRHADIPAVVCMTIPTPETVPNLAAAGIGESYWIHEGVLKPLASVMG